MSHSQSVKLTSANMGTKLGVITYDNNNGNDTNVTNTVTADALTGLDLVSPQITNPTLNFTDSGRGIKIGSNTGQFAGTYTYGLRLENGDATRTSSIGIGESAGVYSQLENSIAIGNYSAQRQQGADAISIGAYSTGGGFQGSQAVAIGKSAGFYLQGNNSVAIGAFAASATVDELNRLQVDNSIILNASGAEFTARQPGFFVKPIRSNVDASNSVNNNGILMLNKTTNEIVAFNGNNVGIAHIAANGALSNSKIVDADLDHSSVFAFANANLSGTIVLGDSNITIAATNLQYLGDISGNIGSRFTAAETNIASKANKDAPIFTTSVTLPNAVAAGLVHTSANGTAITGGKLTNTDIDTGLTYVNGILSGTVTMPTIGTSGAGILKIAGNGVVSSSMVLPTGTTLETTPSSGTNNTTIATTGFVTNAVATAVDELLGGSGIVESLDTIKELANAIGEDPMLISSMSTAIGTKADSDAPIFTTSVSLPNIVTIGLGAGVLQTDTNGNISANKTISNAILSDVVTLSSLSTGILQANSTGVVSSNNTLANVTLTTPIISGNITVNSNSIVDSAKLRFLSDVTGNIGNTLSGKASSADPSITGTLTTEILKISNLNAPDGSYLTVGSTGIVSSAPIPTYDLTGTTPSFTNLTVTNAVTFGSILSGVLQTDGNGHVSATTTLSNITLSDVVTMPQVSNGIDGVLQISSMGVVSSGLTLPANVSLVSSPVDGSNSTRISTTSFVTTAVKNAGNTKANIISPAFQTSVALPNIVTIALSAGVLQTDTNGNVSSNNNIANVILSNTILLGSVILPNSVIGLVHSSGNGTAITGGKLTNTDIDAGLTYANAILSGTVTMSNIGTGFLKTEANGRVSASSTISNLTIDGSVAIINSSNLELGNLTVVSDLILSNSNVVGGILQTDADGLVTSSTTVSGISIHDLTLTGTTTFEDITQDGILQSNNTGVVRSTNVVSSIVVTGTAEFQSTVKMSSEDFTPGLLVQTDSDGFLTSNNTVADIIISNSLTTQSLTISGISGGGGSGYFLAIDDQGIVSAAVPPDNVGGGGPSDISGTDQNVNNLTVVSDLILSNSNVVGGILQTDANGLVSSNSTILNAILNYDESGIKIGSQAGSTNQSASSIAIGSSSGYSNQQSTCIAIGNEAGYETQRIYAIGLGYQAGHQNQGTDAIAIGRRSGYEDQQECAIALGNGAGSTSQGSYTIALGNGAGSTSQSSYSVAIGDSAGQIYQGSGSVAIGYSAAQTEQNDHAIAIGYGAGFTSQSENTIAVGVDAGSYNQSSNCIALGYRSGYISQSGSSIAIGSGAASNTQGAAAIAIGLNAGSQTANSQQHENSIIICAQSDGSGLDAITEGFFVKPIRTTTATNIALMAYDTDISEIIACNTGTAGIAHISSTGALTVTKVLQSEISTNTDDYSNAVPTQTPVIEGDGATGSLDWISEYTGSGRKTIIIRPNTFFGTATIEFPLPFITAPYVYGVLSGVTPMVTTSNITFTAMAEMSDGFIFVDGF